ncbi:cytochrome c oxidase subunit 4 [Bailinhaonella thermotolerans]|uniref:Cytochrome c oxidase polypeptide 4 n=1 Tax=Bailinhaonella thermotolerans TaxID=1070861 RepID=A0A3A4BB46_9ACTN|nr:cytochrome c oxidase subunit 4 [Bailinhaonella thermotolerans]RJL31428.1 cytochrome c oxidase subunit 4 [Bailinhaonella thermotolerans]
MKVQGWLFLICGIFFAATDVVYWFWSKDPTGTTALGITVGLAFMIGYYLLFTARRIGPQPEDNKEAEVSDGNGEIGFFSPHSWWPLFVALAAALATVGFVIGWWLFIIGVAAVLMTTIGFVFQYYRGHFSH